MFGTLEEDNRRRREAEAQVGPVSDEELAQIHAKAHEQCTEAFKGLRYLEVRLAGDAREAQERMERADAEKLDGLGAYWSGRRSQASESRRLVLDLIRRVES